MDLQEIVKTLGRIEKIDRETAKLRRTIRQIEAEIRRRSSQIINLRDGSVKYAIDDEIRRKFGEERISEIKEQIERLEEEKQQALADLEKIHKLLVVEYNRELAKCNMLFKRFINQLKTLEKTWKKLEKLGQPLTNKYQLLWRIKTALNRHDKKIPLIPPYSNWRIDLTHAFTRMHNYLEEVEKHGS